MYFKLFLQSEFIPRENYDGVRKEVFASKILDLDKYRATVARPLIFVSMTTWNGLWVLLQDLYMRPLIGWWQ